MIADNCRFINEKIIINRSHLNVIIE